MANFQWFGVYFVLFFSQHLFAESFVKAVLSPEVEANYELRLECSDGSGSKPCKDIAIPLTLTLLNTPEGLVEVSVHNEQFGVTRWRMLALSVQSGGTIIEAETPENTESRFGEIQLAIDIPAGAVTGWLRDPLYPSDLRVTGNRLQSYAPIFHANPPKQPILVDEIPGKWVDTRGSRSGALQIQKKLTGPAGRFSAVWYHNSGAAISFPIVDFNKERGLLILVHRNNKTSGLLKWVLSIRKSESGAFKAVGVAISSETGRDQSLEFEK